VHRLIRSHVDGKIVEVASPAPGVGAYEFSACCHEEDPYRSDLEEAQIASKLDAIAQEYNHLLSSQLESQRKYFEGMLASSSRETEEKAAAAEARAADMEAKAMAAATEAKEAAGRARTLQRKLEEASRTQAKVSDEKEFLRNLNDTLISNQKEWQRKVATLEQERNEKDGEIKASASPLNPHPLSSAAHTAVQAITQPCRRSQLLL